MQRQQRRGNKYCGRLKLNLIEKSELDLAYITFLRKKNWKKRSQILSLNVFSMIPHLFWKGMATEEVQLEGWSCSRENLV